MDNVERVAQNTRENTIRSAHHRACELSGLPIHLDVIRLVVDTYLQSTAAIAAMEQIAREDAQRERLNARFAGRGTTPATADFDLPAPNDSVDDAPAPPQHGGANG
jgi:hypothetical protein